MTGILKPSGSWESIEIYLSYLCPAYIQSQAPREATPLTEPPAASPYAAPAAELSSAEPAAPLPWLFPYFVWGAACPGRAHN